MSIYKIEVWGYFQPEKHNLKSESDDCNYISVIILILCLSVSLKIFYSARAPISFEYLLESLIMNEIPTFFNSPANDETLTNKTLALAYVSSDQSQNQNYQ